MMEPAVWRVGVGMKEKQKSELEIKERCHDGSDQGRPSSEYGGGKEEVSVECFRGPK